MAAAPCSDIPSAMARRTHSLTRAGLLSKLPEQERYELVQGYVQCSACQFHVALNEYFASDCRLADGSACPLADRKKTWAKLRAQASEPKRARKPASHACRYKETTINGRWRPTSSAKTNCPDWEAQRWSTWLSSQNGATAFVFRRRRGMTVPISETFVSWRGCCVVQHSCAVGVPSSDVVAPNLHCTRAVGLGIGSRASSPTRTPRKPLFVEAVPRDFLLKAVFLCTNCDVFSKLIQVKIG